MPKLEIADLTVLLVEPSVTQQKIITKTLNLEGADKVDSVSTGRAAINYLLKASPDLVISSMYYDDMTALELVRYIREHETLSDVPFMLISSEMSFGRIDPIKQAGVVAILPKPFELQSLHTALKNTLQFLDGSEIELANYDTAELRVLLVDDSKLARLFIKKTLESLGINNIVEADNGKSAIAILDQNNGFDLIVSDYNMPEVDGKELVSYIRHSELLAHIPVLMVTSEQNRAVLNNIEQVGVSAICDKPFEPANVKRLLANILN